MIRVELVYAEPERTISECYDLDAGATIAELLRLAEQQPRWTEVLAASRACGVFGTLARPERELQTGDRVEIYRPLAEDPKAARRRRATAAR